VNTGVPTVGVIVTVCVAVLGPLQPAADAVIVEVPDQVVTYVTCPVDEFMVLPPAKLVASKEYVIPVLFVAEAE
jgi:hypothetical protein